MDITDYKIGEYDYGELSLAQYCQETGEDIQYLCCYRASDGKFLPDPCEFFEEQPENIYVYYYEISAGVPRLTVAAKL